MCIYNWFGRVQYNLQIYSITQAQAHTYTLSHSLSLSLTLTHTHTYNHTHTHARVRTHQHTHEHTCVRRARISALLHLYKDNNSSSEEQPKRKINNWNSGPVGKPEYDTFVTATRTPDLHKSSFRIVCRFVDDTRARTVHTHCEHTRGSSRTRSRQNHIVIELPKWV